MTLAKFKIEAVEVAGFFHDGHLVVNGFISGFSFGILTASNLFKLFKIRVESLIDFVEAWLLAWLLQRMQKL